MPPFDSPRSPKQAPPIVRHRTPVRQGRGSPRTMPLDAGRQRNLSKASASTVAGPDGASRGNANIAYPSMVRTAASAARTPKTSVAKNSRAFFSCGLLNAPTCTECSERKPSGVVITTVFGAVASFADACRSLRFIRRAAEIARTYSAPFVFTEVIRQQAPFQVGRDQVHGWTRWDGRHGECSTERRGYELVKALTGTKAMPSLLSRSRI